MSLTGWLEFDPRSVRAGFAVEKAALEQMSGVSPVSVTPPMLRTHLFTYH